MSKEQIDKMLYFGWDMFNGEAISSLFVMLIICILSFIIYFKFKKADPLKSNNGTFVTLIEYSIEKVEAFTIDLMGKKWINFSGYTFGLMTYIAMCFLIGLMGFPSPFTYLGNTLSIALCTFVLIHFAAARANKWKYFQRYIDPIPVLLPINLLSMWAPLLSLSLRLFGNALAGFTLMSVVYYALGAVSDILFGWINFLPNGMSSIILPPFITPVLHMYFDLFSGLIQTLIFVMLTMIFVSQEDPDEEENSSRELKLEKRTEVN